MSNTEAHPAELTCTATSSHGEVEILEPRDVPLGGPRAMRVRRTLPQRQRSFTGAWCFTDHYGPEDVASSGGMDVAPHPHTGLQTVSWLFTGEIEHRDSGGVHGFVRPGEINLMTGGHGICHSEVSTSNTPTLHGVQLWVALPAHARDAPREFQHHSPDLVELDGASLRVFLGSLAGSTSPVSTHTPLLGAELVLEPGGTVELEVDPAFEHGILVDTGQARAGATSIAPGALAYLPTGRSTITLENTHEGPTRIILLGGTPFEEEIIMWWNFVGRTHEEIARFREDWEERSDRFGAVEGYVGKTERIPAPPLPNAQLKPRRNPSSR
ncbi:pirin family protein [Hoyosella sp. G463]|uniref:Pirin family protein n=1 Tax=Lolliginicoccus lacisalsi TaxID=2742202 RepID=A0A927JB74_9ACTN|nr:pirin family protein [Lolliginicoccus lacisalsi]MBD8505680.1 pirin family protein [Lolliginicoccus lacisalsi]